MVYLGGPRRGRRGIYLHDPPPGYHRPRLDIPFKERKRKARRDFVLMRVTTIVLAVTAVAFIVLLLLVMALHL
jgi:hypothetical protein